MELSNLVKKKTYLFTYLLRFFFLIFDSFSFIQIIRKDYMQLLLECENDSKTTDSNEIDLKNTYLTKKLNRNVKHYLS